FSPMNPPKKFYSSREESQKSNGGKPQANIPLLAEEGRMRGSKRSREASLYRADGEVSSAPLSGYRRSDHPVRSFKGGFAASYLWRGLPSSARRGIFGSGDDVDCRHLILLQLTVRCIQRRWSDLFPLSRRLPSLVLFAVLVTCAFDGSRQ